MILALVMLFSFTLIAVLVPEVAPKHQSIKAMASQGLCPDVNNVERRANLFHLQGLGTGLVLHP
jgi:hypothetical protein